MRLSPRRRVRWWPVVLAVGLVLALAVYLEAAAYLVPRVGLDSKRPSDAVLVLGSRAYLNGRVNQCLAARVRHGVSLYKAGLARTLVLSGGTDREDGRNEAETMAALALGLGVRAADLLLEKRSTSTFENLEFSSALLAQRNARSVIIVSEPFHMPRASLVARRLGIKHTVSPASDSPCWRWTFLSRSFLREPLALLEHGLTGKI